MQQELARLRGAVGEASRPSQSITPRPASDGLQRPPSATAPYPAHVPVKALHGLFNENKQVAAATPLQPTDAQRRMLAAQEYAAELRAQMEEAATKRRMERQALLEAMSPAPLPIVGARSTGPIRAFRHNGIDLSPAHVSRREAKPEPLSAPAARRRASIEDGAQSSVTPYQARWPGSPPRQQAIAPPTNGAALRQPDQPQQLHHERSGMPSAAGNLGADALRAAVASGASFVRNRSHSMPAEARAAAQEKAAARVRYEAELRAQMEEQAARKARERAEASEARQSSVGLHLWGQQAPLDGNSQPLRGRRREFSHAIPESAENSPARASAAGVRYADADDGEGDDTLAGMGRPRRAGAKRSASASAAVPAPSQQRDAPAPGWQPQYPEYQAEHGSGAGGPVPAVSFLDRQEKVLQSAAVSAVHMSPPRALIASSAYQAYASAPATPPRMHQLQHLLPAVGSFQPLLHPTPPQQPPVPRAAAPPLWSTGELRGLSQLAAIASGTSTPVRDFSQPHAMGHQPFRLPPIPSYGAAQRLPTHPLASGAGSARDALSDLGAYLGSRRSSSVANGSGAGYPSQSSFQTAPSHASPARSVSSWAAARRMDEQQQSLYPAVSAPSAQQPFYRSPAPVSAHSPPRQLQGTSQFVPLTSPVHEVLASPPPPTPQRRNSVQQQLGGGGGADRSGLSTPASARRRGSHGTPTRRDSVAAAAAEAAAAYLDRSLESEQLLLQLQAIEEEAARARDAVLGAAAASMQARGKAHLDALARDQQQLHQELQQDDHDEDMHAGIDGVGDRLNNSEPHPGRVASPVPAASSALSPQRPSSAGTHLPPHIFSPSPSASPSSVSSFMGHLGRRAPHPRTPERSPKSQHSPLRAPNTALAAAAVAAGDSQSLRDAIARAADVSSVSGIDAGGPWVGRDGDEFAGSAHRYDDGLSDNAPLVEPLESPPRSVGGGMEEQGAHQPSLTGIDGGLGSTGPASASHGSSSPQPAALWAGSPQRERPFAMAGIRDVSKNSRVAHHVEASPPRRSASPEPVARTVSPPHQRSPQASIGRRARAASAVITARARTSSEVGIPLDEIEQALEFQLEPEDRREAGANDDVGDSEGLGDLAGREDTYDAPGDEFEPDEEEEHEHEEASPAVLEGAAGGSGYGDREQLDAYQPFAPPAISVQPAAYAQPPSSSRPGSQQASGSAYYNYAAGLSPLSDGGDAPPYGARDANDHARSGSAGDAGGGLYLAMLTAAGAASVATSAAGPYDTPVHVVDESLSLEASSGDALASSFRLPSRSREPPAAGDGSGYSAEDQSIGMPDNDDSLAESVKALPIAVGDHRPHSERLIVAPASETGQGTGAPVVSQERDFTGSGGQAAFSGAPSASDASVPLTVPSQAETWGLPPSSVQAHKEALLAFYQAHIPSKARREHVDVAWALKGPKVWDALSDKYPALPVATFAVVPPGPSS